MASLYLLLPVALLFVGVAVALFVWAVRNRQFDDLDREGRRILQDSEGVQRNAGPASVNDTGLPKPESPASSSKEASGGD